MVYKINPEAKSRPRGRPFEKGNTLRKSKNAISDPSGHTSSNEGGIITPPVESSIVPPSEGVLKDSFEHFQQVTKKTIEEFMEPVQLKEEDGYIDIQKKEMEDLIPLTLIESMDFTNGENKLSIRFSKKNNRMFRIQVFLNDESEIRPVTYNGSSTAYGFWNLLKKSLKK